MGGTHLEEKAGRRGDGESARKEMKPGSLLAEGSFLSEVTPMLMEISPLSAGLCSMYNNSADVVPACLLVLGTLSYRQLQFKSGNGWEVMSCTMRQKESEPGKQTWVQLPLNHAEGSVGTLGFVR